jgi:DNA polymerase elongation subunit (family B)
MTALDSSLDFQILGATTKDVFGAYRITIFGATKEGKSVSLAVTGFEPFFYVEIPDEWTARQRSAYENYLLCRLEPKEQAAVSFTVEKHKSFWDFTNNRLFTFLKVQTRSKKLWTRIRDVCQDADTAIPIPLPLSVLKTGANGSITLRVFEANIDPMLRFFHLRELSPAGWATGGLCASCSRMAPRWTTRTPPLPRRCTPHASPAAWRLLASCSPWTSS